MKLLVTQSQNPRNKRYGSALADLQGALTRINRGELPLQHCDSLFRSLMGTVGQLLDQAAEDLTHNTRALNGARAQRPAIAEGADLVADFGDIQDDVQSAVKEIGKVFASCDSLDEFQRRLPILEGWLTSLQGSLDNLERLERRSASPTLAELPAGPLPGEVSRALDHYDGAVKAVLRYMQEGRDRAEIEAALRFSDQARAELVAFLGGAR